ncbi:META domain-containing protein [Gayadomonas joobiniege]|uniref:META domain-containing protein n=1 Tax=Gayadomonas joobiniege TaxID=1234606 RepID=UPI0003780617|nr:META domain-containing protein [Gayadomonas joobiniege]
MLKTFRFTWIGLSASFLMACSNEPPQGAWQLDSLLGDSLLKESKITLEFAEDERVFGNSGCNQYTGSYRFTDGKLDVGQLASTKRACVGPVMEQETKFLKALENSVEFKEQAGQMLAYDADGNALFVMSSAE